MVYIIYFAQNIKLNKFVQMQGKNTGYKIRGQGNEVDGDGFNE